MPSIPLQNHMLCTSHRICRRPHVNAVAAGMSRLHWAALAWLIYLGISVPSLQPLFFFKNFFFFSSNKEIVVGRRHQLFHQKPSRAPNCKATYTKHSKNIMNYWLLDIWAFHCTTRSKSNMNEATSLKKIKLLYEFSKMLLSLNQNVLLLVSSHKK